MQAMLTRLHSDRVNVKLSNGEYGFTTRWIAQLHKSDEGITLQVREEANTPEAALTAAYNKFYRTVETGSPELAAPMIEHFIPEPPVASSDDEIPF